MDTPPAPPPEGVLIRLAREAAGLRVADVAKAAGISIARWSQVENGRETRAGKVTPVRAKAGTLAHMAAAAGVTPERLETEGQRPDAADILREIIRQESARQPGPAPAAAEPPPRYGTLEYLSHTPGLTEAQCEVLIRLAKTWVEPAPAAYQERRRALPQENAPVFPAR